MYDDWALIESSFASQYSVRLRSEELTWNEFATLLSGLLPETPLGRIVSIRAEKDPKVIKQFTPEQKRIQRDWKIKVAKMEKDSSNLDKEMEALSSALKKLFGKNEKQRRRN